ncbi:MAG: Uma2 family endonuclease [Chthoniobacter sp.]|nr:Uma2 family endonuclease [Chthoniobacter sp.]
MSTALLDIPAFCRRVIVSSSTEEGARKALYAEAGVAEYWIVLPRERKIEVYRQPGDGIYAARMVAEGDAVLTCSSVPGVQVALGELFA